MVNTLSLSTNVKVEPIFIRNLANSSVRRCPKCKSVLASILITNFILLYLIRKVAKTILEIILRDEALIAAWLSDDDVSCLQINLH